MFRVGTKRSPPPKLLRDGSIDTDYGEVEVPLETKVAQVLTQLKSGKAVIVFDQETDSGTILRSDDPLVKVLEG